MPVCHECSAVYEANGDNCQRRFDALLALDHSRTEPWGSRHGLAFSAFALQHPDRFPADVPERAWIMLYSVYIEGRDYLRVTTALRRLGRQKPDWGIPMLPFERPTFRFAVTIADLGSFAVETYPQELDRWCKGALDGWRSRA